MGLSGACFARLQEFTKGRELCRFSPCLKTAVCLQKGMLLLVFGACFEAGEISECLGSWGIFWRLRGAMRHKRSIEAVIP